MRGVLPKCWLNKETLNLMRQFFAFTAANSIEDLHYLTQIWIPSPLSVITTEVEIPSKFWAQAALHIQANLGPNLSRVGKSLWQWRKPGSVVRAEWVEMKSDCPERKALGGRSNKVMFYIHGGAYLLGGVGHVLQIQRHARKKVRSHRINTFVSTSEAADRAIID
jgi:acetyl esterase/lipase